MIATYAAQARAWVRANLEPAGAAPDGGHRGAVRSPEHFAAQRLLQRRLFEAGYAGITWPRELGGAGLTREHQLAFDEAAAGYALPDFAPLNNTTFKVCGPTILACASAEFQRRHVPRILAGEELWAQFFSEPDAGSDLAGIRTKAVRHEDGWLLTGSKVWTSGAQFADYGMCLARTDWSVPKHRGLTWFAVPTTAPGLTVRPLREINGGLDFCEESLDGVFVPDADRIGDVDDGWSVCTTMLGFERTAGKVPVVAPRGPGPLPGDLVGAALRRGTTGDPLTRQLIAQAHTQSYVQQLLALHVDGASREDPPRVGHPSYLKLAAGTFGPERARAALQIGGPEAVTWRRGQAGGDATALGYLNARLPAIAGGTNEMQRNAIAERALGLPREPSADRDVPFAEVLRRTTSW